MLRRASTGVTERLQNFEQLCDAGVVQRPLIAAEIEFARAQVPVLLYQSLADPPDTDSSERDAYY